MAPFYCHVTAIMKGFFYCDTTKLEEVGTELIVNKLSIKIDQSNNWVYDVFS